MAYHTKCLFIALLHEANDTILTRDILRSVVTKPTHHVIINIKERHTDYALC